MMDSATAFTNLSDSQQAGTDLGTLILRDLGGHVPDALIVFASAKHDYSALLSALDAACNPRVMIGCSSAGEFTSGASGEGSVSAIALRSPDLRFTASIAHDLSSDPDACAASLVDSFTGLDSHEYLYRTGLILTDALAGHADRLVERLTLLTAGTYQFFGGGAGDDGLFQRTHVFCGTEASSNAAVSLEILSNKPVGIGVCHGWQAASSPMRVTAADGMSLISINATAAGEVFEEHAGLTQQSFNKADPLPFFLHNVLGVETSDGYKLRVPLGLSADGSVACAAEVPENATVCIMGTSSASAAQAAAYAARTAIDHLEGHRPGVALMFDCVATRLRTGRGFGLELDAVQNVLGDTRFVGFNSYGQVVRAEGQFSGFHNCTAVVCIFPE